MTFFELGMRERTFQYALSPGNNIGPCISPCIIRGVEDKSRND